MFHLIQGFHVHVSSDLHFFRFRIYIPTLSYFLSFWWLTGIKHCIQEQIWSAGCSYLILGWGCWGKVILFYLILLKQTVFKESVLLEFLLECFLSLSWLIDREHVKELLMSYTFSFWNFPYTFTCIETILNYLWLCRIKKTMANYWHCKFFRYLTHCLILLTFFFW